MSLIENVKETAQGVAQAAMKKAIEMAPDGWVPGGRPDPLIRQQHGHVGTPTSRLDGSVKVRGAAPFAAEFALDDMVYAAVAFGTIAKGRIATLDTGAAEASSGVVLVMTYRNAPRMQPMPVFMSGPKANGGDDLPIMQDDRIHWNGQPIALVLAGTQEQADHAASLIHATYAEEPAVTSFAIAKAAGTEPGIFAGEPLSVVIGDADTALAVAPHKVAATYRTPRHNHNPIEPHAATVVWDGETLRVHDATQAVAHTAWSLGHVFGLDDGAVRVTSPFVGGGFGSKTLWHHHVLAAAASKLAARPVRIALSREGVYRMVGGRSLTEQYVAIGAEGDGRFTAIVHTGTTAMTRHNSLPEPFNRRNAQLLCRRYVQAGGRGRASRHARQYLHARAGRGSRHLRARIGDRRAGGRDGHRSHRAAAAQRAGTGSDDRYAVLVTPYRRGVSCRCRAVSAGASARQPARGGKESGWWGWAARRRPIPIIGCPAGRHGSP